MILKISLSFCPQGMLDIFCIYKHFFNGRVCINSYENIFVVSSLDIFCFCFLTLWICRKNSRKEKMQFVMIPGILYTFQECDLNYPRTWTKKVICNNNNKSKFLTRVCKRMLTYLFTTYLLFNQNSFSHIRRSSSKLTWGASM